VFLLPIGLFFVAKNRRFMEWLREFLVSRADWLTLLSPAGWAVLTVLLFAGTAWAGARLCLRAYNRGGQAGVRE